MIPGISIKRATYCIIHQLFLVKALRLMFASDDNLSIFFCGIPPMHLMPPILLTLNAASLDRTYSRDATGRQRDKVPSDFRPGRDQGTSR